MADEALGARIAAAWQRSDAARSDAAARFDLAVLYDANGLSDLAAATYADVVALDPENARAWYHLARQRSLAGDATGALEALDRCIALDGGYAPAHARRGELCLEAGRLDDAAAAYTRATELLPPDPTGWIGRARVALQQDRPDDAVPILERLSASRPDDGYLHGLLARALRAQGDTERAEAEAARADAQERRVVFDPWAAEVDAQGAGLFHAIQRGGRLLDQGRPQEALEVLLPLRRAHPDDETIFALTIRGLCDSDQLDRAYRLLDQVLAEGRISEFSLYLQRGIVLARMGRMNPALKHLEHAVALAPTNPLARACLGEALLRTERYDEALAAFERAKSGGEPSARLMVLEAQALQGLDRREDALAALARAREAYPDDAGPWIALARLHHAAGDAEATQSALAEARRRAAGSAELAALEEELSEGADAPAGGSGTSEDGG